MTDLRGSRTPLDPAPAWRRRGRALVSPNVRSAVGQVFCEMRRREKPSTTAVLPTPASKVRSGCLAPAREDVQNLADLEVASEPGSMAHARAFAVRRL